MDLDMPLVGLDDLPDLDYVDTAAARKSGAADNLLTAALFGPDDTALARVVREGPYIPRCSDNKTAILLRPINYAVRWPYMQVNRAGMVAWLIFDLDHGDCWIWEKAGLPPPNLVVRNRTNNRSHLYYAVTPVCTTAKAREKPQQFLKAIYSEYAARLGADLDHHGRGVSKTPGHPWWITTEHHAHVYDLGELAQYGVPMTGPRRHRSKRHPKHDESRNCRLFDTVRHYAYSIVNEMRASSTQERFQALLRAFGERENSFTKQGFRHNLRLSEVRAITKSIARWTWEHYTGAGKGCVRGVMHLDPTLPLDERQRMSAARTSLEKVKGNLAKVIAAQRALLERGITLTIKAIAEVTGLARQTVSRHMRQHALDAAAMNPGPSAPHMDTLPQEQADSAGPHTPNHAPVDAPARRRATTATSGHDVTFAARQIIGVAAGQLSWRAVDAVPSRFGVFRWRVARRFLKRE